jgi:predicted alpha/beta-hydrolase family hydrolase
MPRFTELTVPLTQPQAVAVTRLHVWEPTSRPRGVTLLLAHGAGSDLGERTLVALAAGLADRGVRSATFNFAYRQAGRRPPDRADRLRRVFADVAGAVAARHGPAIVLGGRSMGGRVASLLAAEGHGAGVLALGYPLCPGGGAPDARRTGHWPRIGVPVLFVHGDRDRLCPVDLLDDARHRWLAEGRHRAHVVTGADHGFDVRVRDDRSRADVDAEVVGAVDRWLLDVIEENHHG